MNPSRNRTATVLGAGIQGVLAALALKKSGWQVALIDRAPEPLLGASLRGEGKLHLGYVYGNEPTRQTAGMMVEGALQFAALIDTWVPHPVDWKAISSEPFLYAVLADTMVAPEQLYAHYQWVDDAIAARMASGATYASMRTLPRTRPLPCPRQAGFSGDVIAAYQTSEIAVNPDLLRAALLDALRATDVPYHPHCTIKSVARKAHGFSVEGAHRDGNTRSWHSDAVVNCLWDGRLAIDATMGIPPPRPCLYRMKYAVQVMLDTAPRQPITTTFALGPYGDVVWRGDGMVYLSWYPACMVGLHKGIEPPASWYTSVNDPAYMATRADIAEATISALGARIPALQNARVASVGGGVVVAWGNSDIDQQSSELHRRHAIGVHDHDGYLSVDTGKLTTAPLFAAKVAALLGPGRAAYRP